MASEPSSSRTWLLSCGVACLALGGVLGISLCQLADSPTFVAETPSPAPTEPGDGQPPVLDGRIDPNTAPWHELAQLPRVGEALARRIVAYRETKALAWRSEHPHEPIEHAPPVFTTAEDLLPVKGIGPRTLDLLRPHLRWSEKAAASPVAPRAK